MQFPELIIDYTDRQQCLDLLASVPLTNLDHARDALLRLIGGMLASPPPPLEHLEILEQARGGVAFVASQIAMRYAFQPVPPAQSEDDVLSQVVSIWLALARSYSQVASRGGDLPDVKSRLALICHRCIHCSGQAILEHFRARRAMQAGLWIDLHGYFATAQEWGIADVRVTEPLNEAHHAESCTEAYAAILLVDLANPYSRSPREFAWVARWAHLFAPHTSVVRAQASVDEAKSYGIDLTLDRGLRPMPLLVAGPGLHRFDGSRLAPLIQDKVRRLKDGATPASLELGDDVLMPHGARLLLQLYRPWCHTATTRRFKRRSGGGGAELTFGIDSIHYFVGGAEFEQPEPLRTYSRAEVDSLLTLGERVEGHDKSALREARIGYALENWQVLDQSVAGFRLRRESSESPLRVENGQLLGIRPPDGERVLLARVSWTMYEAGGALSIGVALLPGTPEALAARLTGVNVPQPNRYSRAFVLPPVAALKEEASLVIPRGWFQPERIIEIYYDKRASNVRLIALLQPGVDFERVAYAVT